MFDKHYTCERKRVSEEMEILEKLLVDINISNDLFVCLHACMHPSQYDIIPLPQICTYIAKEHSTHEYLDLISTHTLRPEATHMGNLQFSISIFPSFYSISIAKVVFLQTTLHILFYWVMEQDCD